MTHPTSRIDCVDIFDAGYEKIFDHNVAVSPHTARIRKLVGFSSVVLRDLELDSYDSPRARLFWKSDFAKLIEQQLPGWREVFEAEAEVETEKPKMRLSSAGQEPYPYTVEFIDPNRLIEDIKSEIYEERESNLEGGVKHYFGKRYERNPENRSMAIEIHGMTCSICGFDFEKFYGEHGRGFIEIHHNKPLSSLDEEVVINPATDLSPVCSNCHRIIHRKREQVLSALEMKHIIKQ